MERSVGGSKRPEGEKQSHVECGGIEETTKCFGSNCEQGHKGSNPMAAYPTLMRPLLATWDPSLALDPNQLRNKNIRKFSSSELTRSADIYIYIYIYTLIFNLIHRRSCHMVRVSIQQNYAI
jgi:hypothetical protein